MVHISITFIHLEPPESLILWNILYLIYACAFEILPFILQWNRNWGAVAHRFRIAMEFNFHHSISTWHPPAAALFGLDGLAPGSASALWLPPLPLQRSLCLRLAFSGAVFGHCLPCMSPSPSLPSLSLPSLSPSPGVAWASVVSGRRRRLRRRIRQILNQ